MTTLAPSLTCPACSSAMLQRESDGAITCLMCSRTVQPAPEWEPPHLVEPDEPQRRGLGRLGPRQQRVLDYIRDNTGCTSRMIKLAMVLDDHAVTDTIKSLTARHLVRRVEALNRGDARWMVV